MRPKIGFTIGGLRAAPLLMSAMQATANTLSTMHPDGRTKKAQQRRADYDGAAVRTPEGVAPNGFGERQRRRAAERAGKKARRRIEAGRTR